MLWGSLMERYLLSKRMQSWRSPSLGNRNGSNDALPSLPRTPTAKEDIVSQVLGKNLDCVSAIARSSRRCEGCSTWYSIGCHIDYLIWPDHRADMTIPFILTLCIANTKTVWLIPYPTVFVIASSMGVQKRFRKSYFVKFRDERFEPVTRIHGKSAYW